VSSPIALSFATSAGTFAKFYSRSHDAVIRVCDGAGQCDRNARAHGRFQGGIVNGRAPGAARVSGQRREVKFAHALSLSDFGSKRFVIYGFHVNDSRWIKWFAIATAVLTASLVFLTIVLARYASRLDVLTDALVASQRPNQPSSPTPEQSPTPTASPIPRAIPIATPSLTPSPSPQPTRVPRRHPRRHR
jgi:hypothetical protein